MEKMQEVKRVDLTEWIDKTKYVGTDAIFEILDVLSLNDEIVLKMGEGKKTYLMRINTKMQNDLVDHFGENTNAWIGQNVTIVFSDFTPKVGQKNINKGVSCAFAWPEEVDMTA